MEMTTQVVRNATSTTIEINQNPTIQDERNFSKIFFCFESLYTSIRSDSTIDCISVEKGPNDCINVSYSLSIDDGDGAGPEEFEFYDERDSYNLFLFKNFYQIADAIKIKKLFSPSLSNADAFLQILNPSTADNVFKDLEDSVVEAYQEIKLHGRVQNLDDKYMFWPWRPAQL